MTLDKVFVMCSKKILGKEPFADKMFAKCNGFTECIMAFTECLRHSAKKASPIVHHEKIQVRLVPSFQDRF